MKKHLYTLFFLLIANASGLFAQANIFLDTDSVYVSALPSISEIGLLSMVTNGSGSNVKVRWIRVIEQETAGWNHTFCDNALCWHGSTASNIFYLETDEIAPLKPIFYPNGIPGIGVMRMYYASETPGITWADTAVYVAVASNAVGTVEAERVRDISIFPNPARDLLTVVTADENLQGRWHISDATGKIWATSNAAITPLAGQIPVTDFPSGIYFYHFSDSSGQERAVKKFVVQH